MRLHHLSITAFGPFAGNAAVDFDELTAAGLFLLTGATGAGKTSVLDAVCFALYGQVPGDRSGAKHLRSDHAAADVAPEVVLRLSIGERQFTFTRSPAWMRPKRRGVGETKVQAHVLVEEFRDGAWTVLTNRLDDAGLLVTQLLGMSCSQFTQVAMLPQGRFQAFLRATSTERHAVLQQLFRTDRFERIEHWLVERRTAARRRSEAVAASVLETVNRLREANGADDDPTWSGDLEAAAESGELASWVDAITALAEQRALEAATAADDAEALLTTAQAAWSDAQQIDAVRRRGAAARDELARHQARSVELAASRHRLERHRRAAPLAPLARSAAAAARTAAVTAERWRAYREGLGDLVDPEVSREDLAARVRETQDAHARAVAFAPRARARAHATTRQSELHRGLQQVEQSIAELEHAVAQQPAVIADAVAAVHEARAAAARHPVALARVEKLASALTAARRAELVGLELAAARTDVLTATTSAQQAKETYLDLREARINGMAGELAGQLASGCSCPVCGSATHPAPARSEASAVGRAEEEAARKVLDDAEFELQARQVAVATLEGELASLDERLVGVERSTLPQELDDAHDEVERLEPLVSALDVLVAREDECRARLASTNEEHRAALVTRAELHTEMTRTRESLAAIDQEWSALLTGPGASSAEDADDDLATVTRLRAELVAVLGAAAALLDAWTVAVVQARDLEEQLALAAREAGFGTVADALAALLTDDAATALADELSAADLAVHAASLTVADPEVEAALASAAPDLTAARAEHQAAAARARAASSALSAAAARRARLADLVAQLDDRLEGWGPVREQHRTVAELSSFVEGKGVDNPQRMRLAAYVLAERLRQVVAAANERLAGMTDRRYTLEHSDDRGYGEQRGGLSLRVRDDWNGVHRDPVTLSGGETFVVSLALALGLADTVAHEAGGTDIDTLFIDEGFGSLDADTLEDVMDTLDNLRDGGRVVGLVSHVPELRSRITTQLEVTKGRSGSAVAAMVAAG